MESAFTSAEDLIRAKTRGWLPKTFYSDNKWPTIYRLPRAQMKTLILHGADDEVVPVEMAYQLQKALPASEFFVMPGMGHH